MEVTKRERKWIENMNTFFKIERGKEEIKDFVSRFEVTLRRCKAAQEWQI